MYNGLPSNDIDVLDTNKNNIFAGTGNALYLSTNNGNNWSATGLTGYAVTSLAISDSNIFAGTYRGVFSSSNNGSSWTSVNVGLTDTNITALAIFGNYIFAGTMSGGIWKRPMSELTGIRELNNKESNIDVYPNPAINNLTIESLQKSTIEILNIQGQTIIRQQSQQSKTDIDISGLAKGVYILRLCSNDKTEVTRIVKE